MPDPRAYKFVIIMHQFSVNPGCLNLLELSGSVWACTRIASYLLSSESPHFGTIRIRINKT
jgi:hypothetical protein